MILIPFSKINFKTDYSIDKVKRLLSEKFGIDIQSDKSNQVRNSFKNMIKGYKGEIGENNFEIIQKKLGKDPFKIAVTGQFESDSDSTNIQMKIMLNSNFWMSFVIFGMITGSLAGGIYLFSRISGELNPAFWSLVGMNLMFYLGALIFYQIRKFEMNRLLTKLLDAKKV